MRGRISEDEAVSPVIATVLLMAITVLLASAVYLIVADAVSAPDKGRPHARVSTQALDNGYQVVRITEMSQSLELHRTAFSLLPPEGSNASAISGMVSDGEVYGTLGTNVSFQDRDGSFTVNRGDYFVINSSSVGSTEEGWVFQLRYTRTSTMELAAMTLPPTA